MAQNHPMDVVEIGQIADSIRDVVRQLEVLIGKCIKNYSQI